MFGYNYMGHIFLRVTYWCMYTILSTYILLDNQTITIQMAAEKSCTVCCFRPPHTDIELQTVEPHSLKPGQFKHPLIPKEELELQTVKPHSLKPGKFEHPLIQMEELELQTVEPHSLKPGKFKHPLIPIEEQTN